jgi:hypothetical protein
MLITPALERLRQKDCKVKASLGYMVRLRYIARLCFKKAIKKTSIYIPH